MPAIKREPWVVMWEDEDVKAVHADGDEFIVKRENFAWHVTASPDAAPENWVPLARLADTELVEREGWRVLAEIMEEVRWKPN